MNKSFRWMLRKGGKKERCPQCGRLRFVPFVLTADPSVKAGEIYGRCDREHSCGYFRYPYLDRDEVARPTPASVSFEDIRKIMTYKPVFEPLRCNNTLYTAFATLLPPQALELACQRYHIGTGSRGECIFYQYDGQDIRTGKAIMYGPDGHRLNGSGGVSLPVWWMHKAPSCAFDETKYRIKQCLFGQHLLEKFLDFQVWVVESEKTAVLMTATDIAEGRDGRIWLACGGSQMLKGSIDLGCLKGRDVTLIPDDGQYWNWLRTAKQHGWNCIDISDLVIDADMPAGSDIWDLTETRLILKKKSR